VYRGRKQERQKAMNWHRVMLLVSALLILLGLVSAPSCIRSTGDLPPREETDVVAMPTEAQTPTFVPSDTPTVVPTETSTTEPTVTPSPTPTDTRVPTDTPTAIPTDTPPTGTPTPTATSTPLPTPNATPTSVLGTTWHGVGRTPETAWRLVKDDLGGAVIEHLVKPSVSDADILGSLNRAQAMDLRVLLHIYDAESNTRKPWRIEDGTWDVSERGIEILRLVEGHPALFAVYALHEPYDSSDYHADSDAQRALYALLKSYANVPLYTDIATLHMPLQFGELLSDGMCDYCATFPTTFRGSSEAALAETFRRIDADLAAQRQYMPGSQLVFLVNVYQIGDGVRYRLPTEEELVAVRDYVCELDTPILYYPWAHSGYDVTLNEAAALWPTIAAGCEQ